MTSITSIITLPVKVGLALTRRVSEALGRGADALEPDNDSAPGGAREPTAPTAAEAEAVVGERTDGIAEAGPAPTRRRR